MQDIEQAFALGAGLVRAADHPRLRSRLYQLAAEGQLRIILPGVFAQPGGPDPETRLRALCLWCPHGVVHERTAMALWLGEPVARVRLAVAVKRNAPGVILTRRRIPAGFVTRRAGITLARPAYAAAECAAWDEGRALMMGLREGLIHPDELAAALSALVGTLGQQRRERLVRAAERNPWSHCEMLLQRILLAAGIDGWVANHAIRVHGRRYLPDLCFPSARLIVEFDGYAVHSTREQFRDDRERQNALVTAGYGVLRFTWEDITDRPGYVVATVRAALAADNNA